MQKYIFKIGNLIFAALASSTFINWEFDDAHIVFRIVDNLKSGNGWTFNHGEGLNASTSALQVIQLYLISYLCNDNISLAAHILGTFWISVATVSVFCLLSENILAAFITAISLAWYLINNSSWGIEGHLAWGLVFLILFLYKKGLKYLPIFMLGFCILARPDLILFAAAFLSYVFILDALKTKKFPSIEGAVKTFSNFPFVKYAVLILIVILPWFIYSYINFNSVFPDTLSAKRWQGASGLWGSGHVFYKGWKEHVFSSRMLPVFFYLTGFIGAIISIITIDIFAPFFLYAIFHQIAYTFLNVPGYHWYYQASDCIAIVGSGFLLSKLYTFLPRNKPTENLATAIIFSIFCFYVYKKPYQFDGRKDAYQKTAETILKFHPKSIAALETGSLAYYTHTTMVDLTGLTTRNKPYIIPDYIDNFFNNENLPEIVVVHNPRWHFENTVVQDVRFQAFYDGPNIVEHPIMSMAFYVLNTERAKLGNQAVEDFVYSKYKKIESIALSQVSPNPKALCIVDQINGSLTLSDTVTVNQRLLSINGWGVPGRDVSSLNEISFILHGTVNKNFSCQVRRKSRVDVAKDLGNINLNNAGFDGSCLLPENINGKFEIYISMEKDIWCMPGKFVNVNLY